MGEALFLGDTLFDVGPALSASGYDPCSTEDESIPLKSILKM